MQSPDLIFSRPTIEIALATSPICRSISNRSHATLAHVWLLVKKTQCRISPHPWRTHFIIFDRGRRHSLSLNMLVTTVSSLHPCSPTRHRRVTTSRAIGRTWAWCPDVLKRFRETVWIIRVGIVVRPAASALARGGLLVRTISHRCHRRHWRQRRHRRHRSPENDGPQRLGRQTDILQFWASFPGGANQGDDDTTSKHEQEEHRQFPTVISLRDKLLGRR